MQLKTCTADRVGIGGLVALAHYIMINTFSLPPTTCGSNGIYTLDDDAGVLSVTEEVLGELAVPGHSLYKCDWLIALGIGPGMADELGYG